MEEPPFWTLECQKSFNGWSLFNSETYSFLSKSFQEVPSAAGPMMAIRRTVYDLVQGFPPDTVGVETNKGPKSFNKLYIGPGDYGLCMKVRDAGFKVYFSNDIAVFHVIPPVRFTVEFWRSRMIGEGYHQAISQRGFFHLGKLKAYIVRLRHEFHFYRLEDNLLSKLQNSTTGSLFIGMHPDELWLFYYKAYLDMDFVLRRHPDLWRFLWTLGDNGVADKDYKQVIEKLPNEYKDLVSSEFVYDTTPINSFYSYENIIQKRGHYPRGQIIFFAKKIIIKLLISISKMLRR
jgi:hypothetical protein